MLVEIHMIQNHAPSNLNRDDTNSPKDAVFGGSLRARISSQCLKRSIRRSPLFEEAMVGHLATRTRRLPALLKDELKVLGCDDDTAVAIARKATEIGSGKPDEKDMTRQLIFFSSDELKALARELKALLDREGLAALQKRKIDEIEKYVSLPKPTSVDVALFGRMTTSVAFEDVEAAVQVAHAISTGKVEKQFDYFTAVDDLVEAADELGAGMIGDVEFNAATYYKYFSIDWDQLVKNLGGDTETARRTLGAFIKAAALTAPSGKQNTFAAHNPPDAILVEVKPHKIPTSYANAFISPVKANDEKDTVEQSIERLATYANRLKAAYDISTVACFALTVNGQSLPGATKTKTLAELIAATQRAIGEGREGGA